MNTKSWLRTWVEWKWTGYRLNNFYDEVLNGSKQQQHCMKTEDLSCPSLLHSWTSVKFLILISIRCCKNLDIWGTSAIQSFSLQSYYSKKKKCCLTVKRSRFRTGCYFSPTGKPNFPPWDDVQLITIKLKDSYSDYSYPVAATTDPFHTIHHAHINSSNGTCVLDK